MSGHPLIQEASTLKGIALFLVPCVTVAFVATATHTIDERQRVAEVSDLQAQIAEVVDRDCSMDKTTALLDGRRIWSGKQRNGLPCYTVLMVREP